MKKKLIVLSADAMVTEDLEYMKTLPNYQKYLSGACIVERVKSIYPTITYPCHTTMCTGVYPNRHGILGNIEFWPGVKNAPWKWMHDWVKYDGDDLFTTAKKNGLTTCAVFWPVTGNHPDIDYLIDEYWPQTPEETLTECFKRAGSSDEVLDIVKMYEEGTVIKTHPGSEIFIANCTCEIIRRYQPDLIMIHPANIDSYRHGFGLFNDKVTKGVEETDQWIGQIFETLEECGLMDEYSFVLTADHGQMDVNRIINLNVFLADAGLIKVENGEIVNWDAYFLSGGASGLVYLKDPANKEVYDKTYALLNHMKEEGIYGIGDVFTEPEANEKYHLGGDFAFAIENDGYTGFGEEWERPVVVNFNSSDYRYGHATHGYLPDNGPQPILVCKGPAFNENVVLDRRDLVDEAPTFAAALGLELPGVDGKVITEFLK